VSAGFAVPIFAFFAAGVDLRSLGFTDALSTPVALGVLVGLVIGEPIGVFSLAWLTARFTRASLAPGIAWRDIFAVGLLAGIGFTVALLITELAFTSDTAQLDSAKTAVLTASAVAATLASVVLISRNRHYAALRAEEERDEDGDGIPDVYQQEPDR
jgi:NhaA family Na+:H+ antiporter